MANTSINVPVEYTLEEEMAYWDTLPAWLRNFLSELPIVMSPIDAYELWMGGEYTEDTFKEFLWGEVIYWMNEELNIQDDNAEAARRRREREGRRVRKLRIVLPRGFWPRVKAPVKPLRPMLGKYMYSEPASKRLQTFATGG